MDIVVSFELLDEVIYLNNNNSNNKNVTDFMNENEHAQLFLLYFIN
jgi:hypothetical protein